MVASGDIRRYRFSSCALPLVDSAGWVQRLASCTCSTPAFISKREMAGGSCNGACRDLGTTVFNVGKSALELQAQQGVWMLREVAGYNSGLATRYDQTMATLAQVWENRGPVLSASGTGVKPASCCS